MENSSILKNGNFKAKIHEAQIGKFCFIYNDLYS